MIKKLNTLIIIGILTFFCFESRVYAQANTLADLKSELAALKSQKSKNEAQTNKTQSEINSQKNNIADCNAAVLKAEEDVENSKKKIIESNNSINKLKEESEKLVVFYQQIREDETLISYITDASSMTEMIIRMNSISQILTYNEERLKKLEQLIVDNEKLQVDRAKKEIELEKRKKEYENSLVSLQSDLKSLSSISLDINQQISAQQELIKYYENIGCKDNDLLSVCVSVANSQKFMRPLNRGYISSVYGYRNIISGVTTTTFHSGTDIAGNKGGVSIYSPASGTVAAVINKSSCGGNQVFIHVRVKGVAYTVLYAHLLSINVKVGDKVTTETIVGTVGGGGSTLKKNGGWDTCSTGYHLHYSVAKGFYLGGGSEGYSSYSKFVANLITPPNLPAYGQWFYSRYA